MSPGDRCFPVARCCPTPARLPGIRCGTQLARTVHTARTYACR
jgi:hypothetical protein